MSRKLCNPAAERNKQPILETLKLYLDGSRPGKLLEISSGSGQHVAHIAPHFPKIDFQPTEFDTRDFDSIRCHAQDAGLKNVAEPQFLDVRMPWTSWLHGSIKPGSYEYVLNINMMHISEWMCTEGCIARLVKEFKVKVLNRKKREPLPQSALRVLSPNEPCELGFRIGGWELEELEKEVISSP